MRNRETNPYMIVCWLAGVVVVAGTAAGVAVVVPPDWLAPALSVLSLGVSGGYALGAVTVAASRDRNADVNS